MNAAVLMMLGCMAKAPPEVAPYSPPPGTWPRTGPLGWFTTGCSRQDVRFSLPIVEGWVAQPGPETGLRRVVLQHVATETRVEVWAFSGEGLEPRVREGCVWTFQTKGRARTFSDEVLLATCVPDDATQRRVYGTIFQRNGTLFQVEIQPPNDALLEGRGLANELIDGLMW